MFFTSDTYIYDDFNFLIIMQNQKYSLILGSGGIKGIAHIGVLKELESKQILPDQILGSSMGALIGALYAKGYSANKIQELFCTIDLPRYFDLNLFHITRTLIKGSKLKALIRDHLDISFSDLKIPLIVSALDLNKGVQVLLSKGSVFDAVMASIALPGIFEPVEIKGKHYSDAGIVFPIPVGDFSTSNLVISDVTEKIFKKPDLSKGYMVVGRMYAIGQKVRTDEIIKSLKAPGTFNICHINIDTTRWWFLDLNSDFRGIISKGKRTAKAAFKDYDVI